MSISSSDIRSWTNVGAQDAAARTYQAVQFALDRSRALADIDYEVFLQGSYANSTNTRGDSDVDIVVMLKTTFIPELGQLTPLEQTLYESDRIPGTVHIETFRTLVQAALVAHFGSHRVKSKNKCLRVDRRDGYVDADVVPCYQHRLYTRYPSYGSPEYIEGIEIRPLTGNPIRNFPKRHKQNGEAKNLASDSLYKPTVRQVKRLRRRAVDEGLVAKDQAPGYLLECLTYNAPRSVFVRDDVTRLNQVIEWLDQFTPDGLRVIMDSADEIHKLFVDDPGQHNEYTAVRTIEALRGLL